MAIEFQPKIIIGSVCGIVASVVGFIAIFFPSLFNLETKKIDEYTATLSTKEDAQKLYNFLEKHQNAIVKLDLSYKETKIFKWQEVKNSKGEVVNYVEETLLEEGARRETGDDAIGVIDKDGYFSVNSKYIREPYCLNFFRNIGGIGVWVSGQTATWKEDVALQIVIPRDSEGNKLYQWGFKDKNNRYDETGAEMRLVGTFFVNAFTSTQDYTGEVIGFMSRQWLEVNESLSGDTMNDTQVVELEPLSKKELEAKNY